CDLRRIAAPDLETDNIYLVCVFSLLPDETAGVPFLLSGLEKPCVDLFKLDREVMGVRVQLAAGKIPVTVVELFFKHPGRFDSFLPINRRYLHHTGVCITIDHLVSLLLNDPPGMLNDRPAHRGDGGPD